MARKEKKNLESIFKTTLPQTTQITGARSFYSDFRKICLGTLKWFEKSLRVSAALANTLHDSSHCWTLRRIGRVSSHSSRPLRRPPSPPPLSYICRRLTVSPPPQKNPKKQGHSKKKGSWFWSSAMKHIMLRNVKRAEDYIILMFIYKINNTYWLILPSPSPPPWLAELPLETSANSRVIKLWADI